MLIDMILIVLLIALLWSVYRLGFYTGTLRELERGRKILEASNKAQHEQLNKLSGNLLGTFAHMFWSETTPVGYTQIKMRDAVDKLFDDEGRWISDD